MDFIRLNDIYNQRGSPSAFIYIIRARCQLSVLFIPILYALVSGNMVAISLDNIFFYQPSESNMSPYSYISKQTMDPSYSEATVQASKVRENNYLPGFQTTTSEYADPWNSTSNFPAEWNPLHALSDTGNPQSFFDPFSVPSIQTNTYYDS